MAAGGAGGGYVNDAPGTLVESKTDEQPEAAAAKATGGEGGGGDDIEAQLHSAYKKTSRSSSASSASANDDASAETTSPIKAAPKSIYNRTKSDARWDLMSRAHMAQALMCLAVENAVSAQTAESTQDAICRLFDGPLSSLWHGIVRGYTMYRNMHDRTFVEAFVNTYAVLKQAFLTFGSTHPEHGPHMSAEKCIWLFKNSLFVGSGMSEEEQEGAVVSAFLDSQLRGYTHGATGLYSSSSGAAGMVEFPHLVFSEFMEVLASVALVSEHDSGMDVGKKMRLAFNTIAQLQPPPEAKGEESRARESKK